MAPVQGPDSTAQKVFFGPNGLRAGWRLLIFLAILCALVFGLLLLLRLMVHGRRESASLAIGGLMPAQVGRGEGVVFILVCIATAIMGVIERRTFAHCGLPWRQAFRKNFWQGLLWGFVAISGVLLVIALFHGFTITGVANHGAAAAGSAAAWGVAFLIVGFSEEFTLRGYAQFTLTTGIGFWPSAFLLSIVFALLHAKNSGETWFGLVSVAIFGLFFCLTLRRTGDLWWAIGFHAAWDWGQTFFYGVPDSGLAATGNLFSAAFHGPGWLTGGTVGPEASIFTPLALVLVSVFVSLRYREARYPDPGALSDLRRRAAPGDSAQLEGNSSS